MAFLALYNGRVPEVKRLSRMLEWAGIEVMIVPPLPGQEEEGRKGYSVVVPAEAGTRAKDILAVFEKGS